MYRRVLNIFIISLAVIVSSCTPDWEKDMIPEISAGPEADRDADRKPGTDTRKVMLLYSAAFNSLSGYLKEDIEDLCSGWVPRNRRPEDVLLVYSHQPSARYQYTTDTSPVLFRIYSDTDGAVVRDTLVTYEPGTISASASQLGNVLSYVKETFPAQSYGMVFSSHATGFLPEGFYSRPDEYTFNDGFLYRKGAYGEKRTPRPVPYVEPEQTPGLPAVKSIGQDVSGDLSYEMDLRDFADAIPMKLDYILFDACLMGGIEVAYELAGKCGMVGFSQAEVLAEGFNYRNLSSHLLGNKEKADPYSVCKDYFTQYDIQSGVYRSATISLVDCNRLESLAGICRTLFERYSEELKTIKSKDVQRFYRASHHWFYDLESILVNAGISEAELSQLHDALEECVIYKGSTPMFMSEFSIDTFCGFSMYLPADGHTELNKYYKTLKWNKATGLVK